jgi:hypothetical protein
MAEVADLEADLRELQPEASISQSQSQTPNIVDPSAGIWRTLTDNTKDLHTRLEGLQSQAISALLPSLTTDDHKGFATTDITAQRLTSALSALRGITASTPTSAPASTDDGKKGNDVAGSPSTLDIVRAMLTNPPQSITGAASQPTLDSRTLVEVESRIAAMEEALGLARQEIIDAYDSSSVPPSLHKTSPHILQQLHNLTPSTVEDVAQRAVQATAALRSLRQEYEHVNSAAGASVLPRPPPPPQTPAADGSASAVSAGGGFALVSDARLLRALATLETLEAAASHTLPALASRLASLDALHREAALFSHRLRAAESAVASIDSSLAEDREVLREVKASINEVLGQIRGSKAK